MPGITEVACPSARPLAHDTPDMWDSAWHAGNQGNNMERMTKEDFLNHSWITVLPDRLLIQATMPGITEVAYPSARPLVHDTPDMWDSAWHAGNQGINMERMTKEDFLNHSWITVVDSKREVVRPKALDPRKKVAVRLEEKV